jgi:hypothetical protein
LGLPPLTRTEEKSLIQELIKYIPPETTFITAEQWTRSRACEIVRDNYLQQLQPNQIVQEWFYDFLLRHPPVLLHFQHWFSSVPSQWPDTDQLLQIKIWQLGLVTRAIMSSTFPHEKEPRSFCPNDGVYFV